MAIVTANLQCNLDSTNPASNTGTGNTWFDLSANNLDFTGTGTSRISFAGIDCFDLGSGKYFEGPNNLSSVIDYDADWTVELWINVDGSQASTYHTPWGTGTNTSGAGGFNIQTHVPLGTRGYFAYTGNSYEITVYPAATIDITRDSTTIHQFVTVKTGGTVQFFLDGAPSVSGSGITNAISLNSDPFYIGYHTFYNAMVGKVAALRAYDVALTNGEVLQNYYSGPTSTAITEFDFSDTNSYSGSGNTVYDISGFGNYGLITGATFAGSGTSKYFEFTGTNDNIYSPVTLLPNASNPVWTENIWFQAEPGSDKIIYCYGTNPPTSNSGTTILAYGFSAIHGGNFFYEAGSGADRINLGFGATSGVWNNLVLSASGTTVSAYFAGSFITSGPQTESILAPKNMNFSGLSNGTSAPNGYMFDGKIAIFRVYNYAQTAGEISTQFTIDDARFGGGPPPPPAYVGLVGGRTFGQGFAG